MVLDQSHGEYLTDFAQDWLNIRGDFVRFLGKVYF